MGEPLDRFEACADRVTMFAKLALVLSATLVIAVGVGVLNPGNIFTPRSTKFSFDKFERLQIGDPADIAVEELGEPIDIQPAGPWGDCKGCSVYLFLGDAPKWVILYEEAWILVDSRGTIVSKVRVREP
jgi:hypothetical protein